MTRALTLRIPFDLHAVSLSRSKGAPARLRRWGATALVALVSGFWTPLQAQTTTQTATAQRSVNEWLTRMHEASRQRAYMGTLVVSDGTSMSAARIWHVCDGVQQMERVDTLTGAPRTTIRRNSDVITFVPDSKTAWVEKRESLGLFPELLRTPSNAIPSHYGVRESGVERVAGYLADRVEIVPKDNLRFGYRIWSEKKTGLVVKLQTVGNEGRVLEQVAFSELDLQSPVRADQLERLMDTTAGYQVVASTVVKTTARAEGWVLRQPVAGFMPVSCYRRSVGTANAADGVLQCIYSDGLATVSLFIQPFDPRHPAASSEMTGMGATQMLTQRLAPDVWLTAVGEVPLHTLQLFANQLERLR